MATNGHPRWSSSRRPGASPWGGSGTLRTEGRFEGSMVHRYTYIHIYIYRHIIYLYIHTYARIGLSWEVVYGLYNISYRHSIHVVLNGSSPDGLALHRLTSESERWSKEKSLLKLHRNSAESIHNNGPLELLGEPAYFVFSAVARGIIGRVEPSRMSVSRIRRRCPL